MAGDSGGSGSNAIPYLIVFVGLTLVVAVIWNGIQESHKNDPDQVALRTPVTLVQMEIVDKTVVTAAADDVGNGAVITYHIDTTNNSGKDYTITYCEPNYLYLWDMKPCTTWKVKAHSTVKQTKTKATTQKQGFALPHDVPSDAKWDAHEPDDNGRITMIDQHPVVAG
jgi:hypothetical protein